MEKINYLLFSKDRPMQLELAIRSIKEKLHIPYTLYAQYTHSNEFYKGGYDLLKKMHPEVIYIRESTVRNSLILAVHGWKEEYLMFDADDSVFVQDVSQEEFNTLFNTYTKNPKIHTISFRMNPTINYCYPAKKEIEPPHFIENTDKYILWDWTKSVPHYCWGYPMSAISHIYKKRDILPIIMKNEFTNVNSLESVLNRNRFWDKSLMISFKETKCFSVQNNFVKSESNPNDACDFYSIAGLNLKFLEGYIISTENIYGHVDNKAHGHIPYFLQKNL